MSEETKNYKAERYNRRTLNRILADVFKENPLKEYGFEDLISLLNIEDNASKEMLQLVLNELVEGNKIQKNEAGNFQTVIKTGVVIGILDLSRKGQAFVREEQSGAEISVPNENLHNALHGDRVEIALSASKSGKQEGEVHSYFALSSSIAA